MGSKGQNSTFSKYGHVAYQIKGNHECSNIVANILLADPLPQTPRNGVNRSKFSFFRIWSWWNHELQQHGSKYFARRSPPHVNMSICQKSTFSEHSHVAYQIKGNHECSNMAANILHADTLPAGP